MIGNYKLIFSSPGNNNSNNNNSSSSSSNNNNSSNTKSRKNESKISNNGENSNVNDRCADHYRCLLSFLKEEAGLEVIDHVAFKLKNVIQECKMRSVFKTQLLIFWIKIQCLLQDAYIPSSSMKKNGGTRCVVKFLIGKIKSLLQARKMKKHCFCTFFPKCFVEYNYEM